MRFLKDYLYTGDCLIRGHVKTGESRLSNFLNKTNKGFLEVEESTVIWHDGRDPIHAPRMQMRIQDILFAYESEDTGDDVLRNLAESARDETDVTACFAGANPLQVSGKVSRRILDFKTVRQHNFFVILGPELRGLTAGPEPEYDAIRNMPYAIVNMDRVSFLLFHTGA